MSIEITLERIATALEIIASNKSTKQFSEPAPIPTQAAPLVANPALVMLPAQATFQAVVVPVVVPVVEPVAVVAPIIPFTPAAVSTAPFADKAGLTAYTMSVYKELGAVKGAQIQNVLVGLGVSNINEVTPAMYSQYHAALEALKAA